jgi:hypothetical protein
VQEGQTQVVEAEQVEHRGVEVVHGHGIDDGFVSDLIGFAETGATFYARAGHPGHEALRIVIASVFALRDWHASEFTTPDDERGFHQTTLLQIREQTGNRNICGTAMTRMVFREITVGVPFTITVDLNKSDATFHESARQETFRAVRFRLLLINSVHFASGLRLLRKIDHGRGF